jgi:hypothetical protein
MAAASLLTKLVRSKEGINPLKYKKGRPQGRLFLFL